MFLLNVKRFCVCCVALGLIALLPAPVLAQDGNTNGNKARFSIGLTGQYANWETEANVKEESKNQDTKAKDARASLGLALRYDVPFSEKGDTYWGVHAGWQKEKASKGFDIGGQPGNLSVDWSADILFRVGRDMNGTFPYVALGATLMQAQSTFTPRLENGADGTQVSGAGKHWGWKAAVGVESAKIVDFIATTAKFGNSATGSQEALASLKQANEKSLKALEKVTQDLKNQSTTAENVKKATEAVEDAITRSRDALAKQASSSVGFLQLEYAEYAGVEHAMPGMNGGKVWIDIDDPSEFVIRVGILYRL